MEIQRLSANLISVIDAILKNQTLVNYIGHNGDNPSINNISAPTIAPKAIGERIVPYPFDVKFTGDVRSQVNVYYPSISFKNNGTSVKVVLLFDIVVHKKIWLVSDNGRKLIRPYQIAELIVDTFKDKRVKGIGEIHFLEAEHTMVNDEFEGLRLVAQFTEF